MVSGSTRAITRPSLAMRRGAARRAERTPSIAGRAAAMPAPCRWRPDPRGRQPAAPARARGRQRADGLRRPAVQHRPHADAPQPRDRRRAADGDRTGFGGRRYATKLLAESSYKDDFDDYLGFLAPRLEELRRVLHPTGTLYLHLDYREAHYVKLLLDELFGRECFLNELIWAYDYGAKPQGPLAAEARHDPRLRQGPARLLLRLRGGRPRALHGARAGHAREGGAGKRPVSVMWHTIVSPTGREKTGYPTQKPEGLLRRFVQALQPRGRPVPGPVRRLRHARRRRGASSAAATC